MTLGRPGDLLADRYRLDRFMGGVGSVERWRAYDERLARPVIARLEPAADAEQQDEATAAAQAAQAALTNMAQLNHPGVAAVYDVGTDDELRGGAVGYAISEWTEGRTLGQIMSGGPQPWPRTADWGRQISGALAALHGIGIAHGALSPQSVAIHDDRQVKILDVGLDAGREQGEGAREEGTVRSPRTQDSDIEGEDAPAATEPALPAGAPNDVYALGFLLWEATVGAAPEYVIPEAAAGTDAEAAALEAAGSGERPTAAGIDEQPLLATGAPVEFTALLAQMLAANPQSRPTAAQAEQRFAAFAGAERVSDTLSGIASATAHTQVLGPPIADTAAAAAAAEAAKAEQDRRRGRALGLVLLVAAVLAGLGFLLANLTSHSTGPTGVNTIIPSSSPGMVTLPNGSLSPAPSQSPTSGGQATTAAPSTPASSAAASQSPTSPATSASPSSSVAPTSTPTAPASGGPPSSPSGPGGSTASATATTGHILPHATAQN